MPCYDFNPTPFTDIKTSNFTRLWSKTKDHVTKTKMLKDVCFKTKDVPTKTKRPKDASERRKMPKTNLQFY
jgi:hypothetical protein